MKTSSPLCATTRLLINLACRSAMTACARELAAETTIVAAWANKDAAWHVKRILDAINDDARRVVRGGQ